MGVQAPNPMGSTELKGRCCYIHRLFVPNTTAPVNVLDLDEIAFWYWTEQCRVSPSPPIVGFLVTAVFS